MIKIVLYKMTSLIMINQLVIMEVSTTTHQQTSYNSRQFTNLRYLIMAQVSVRSTAITLTKINRATQMYFKVVPQSFQVLIQTCILLSIITPLCHSYIQVTTLPQILAENLKCFLTEIKEYRKISIAQHQMFKLMVPLG